MSCPSKILFVDPPVGVKFEADNIYTLDSNGRMILTILASVAEEESHSKSIIMNWSIDRRFSRGLFLTPALLGYDKDEEGNLVINPEEAQTVKVIYYLYLNGYSLTEIATLLMEYGIGSHDLRGFWVGQENVLSADRKSFSTAATCFV